MTSKRETILETVNRKLLVTDGITTVRRKPISSVKELQEIAHTMFPVVTIQGGLPRPSGGNPIELGDESFYSAIRSELDVFVRIFGYERDDPDTAISEMMNIVYQNLYYDPTLKGYDFTTKSADTAISTGDVVLCVDNMISTYAFNFYEALSDFSYGSLDGLPYGNPAAFTDVTDSLGSKVNSVSVRPSEIMEYRDPYYIFTLIMTVEYTHKTIEI